MTDALANRPALARLTGNRRWVLLGIQLSVAAGMMALLWFVADGRAAFARLASADIWWLLACWLAINLQTVLSALRWRLTAQALGVPIRAGRAVSEYYVAQLVNQTLPGGVLGDVTRAVRSRHGADLVKASQAVIIERMAGQLALGSVMIAGFAASLATPGGIAWPLGDAARIAALALVVLIALALVWAVARRAGPFARFGEAASSALLTRRMLPRQIGLGLCIVGCNLAAFVFAARATGTPLGLEAAVTLVPLILFAMVLPLTIGGWGFREGSAAALFPLAGATTDAGLAASVAFGLVILASALPGAFFILGQRGKIGTE
jgi:uncharacterized membrane protein YbhN (UPF0104 family)